MTAVNSPSAATTIFSTGLLPAWRWWLAELRAMFPASISRWIDGDTIATNVSIDEHGLTIIHGGSLSAKPIAAGRVPLDGLASNPVLRELIAAGRDRVRLLLTPDQAMVRTITLPIATEENLREVVGFELDRHTPFTPDQAYYDVQIVNRDVQQEKIVVTLVVTSKVEVAALMRTLGVAGLICTSIGVDGAAGSHVANIDLQPVSDKPARRLSRVHQMNLGLLGLAALLAIVAIVLPLWQKREAIKVLIPQAEKTGAEFQLSERVYSEYIKLAGEYNFLVAKKHAVYPVLSVLEELAQTFTDSTWVQKLDIKPNGKVREVIILGEAQSASKVIENLEQSPLSLFQNSKQQSQTMGLRPNTERFHVSAEIKPRPVPAALGFDEVTATPASLVPMSIVPAAPVATPLTSTPAVDITVPAAPAFTPMQPAPSAAAPAAPPAKTMSTPVSPPGVSPGSPSPPVAMPVPAPPVPGKRSGT